jgi:putative oxidoreductase
MKFLHLNFLPRSADFALLLLRLWFGLSLLWLHGWGKVANYSSMAEKFPDVLGLGSSKVTLILAIFGEVICAGLVALGLFTRVAALGCGTTMFVAFWVAHGHRLTGQGNGELAFMYLGAFVALFVAGGGKYSIDARIGART